MINKENDFDLNCKWNFPDFRKHTFAFISIFVLLMIIYFNSFQGAWLFDDFHNIVENPQIHLKTLSWPDIKNTFFATPQNITARSVAKFSFALNYYVDGLNVFGYHLVNFIIHYLTAIFLFLFIFKTLCLPKLKDTYEKNAYSIALIATFFWAISPLQVTAVTYIVQRMASMAGLFYIITMYFYLLGRTSPVLSRQIVFFSGALLFAMLSFASKENTAMLPVSVFLYDLLLIQEMSKTSLKRNMAIALAPMAFLVLLFLWKLDISAILRGFEDLPFTMTERLLTQPRIIFFYIYQLLYPLESNLALIHDFPVSTGLLSPVTTILSILGIAVAILFAVVRSAKSPLLSFSILFFFINHVIEGSFIPLELVYEHRNYIPSFFFFVPIAIFITLVLKYFSSRRFIQFTIVLLLAAIWTGQGHTVYKRNGLFSDPLALWYDNAMKAPGSSSVYTNLGNALNNRGANNAAYGLFLQAESLGTFLNVINEGVNLYHLGNYYLRISGQPEKAHSYFEKAANKVPADWRPWQSLALSKIALGRFAEGEAIALQLRDQLPDNVDFHYILGLCYLKQNKFEPCKQTAWQALKQSSQHQVFLKLLGAAYYYKGDFKMALKYWHQALQTEIKNPVMLLALMDTYDRLGQYNSRNRIVEMMLCLKEDRTWDGFIKEAARDNSLNVYIIRPQALLPVIGRSLRGIAP